MENGYVDSHGNWHHIASFGGKHNMLKSLVLLALKTEPNNGSLSARQLSTITGLGFDSVKSSLSRWQRWHNHYLNRKGRKKQYRYSLANYGIEFLKILHLIAPDKEQEFLNIIAANRQRIERERIVMPNDERISSAGEITRDEQAMKTRDFIKKYLPNWRDTREDRRRDV
ncbi:MAG: hypothetical protein WCF70_00930 [Dehalococcoidales bacterium]